MRDVDQTAVLLHRRAAHGRIGFFLGDALVLHQQAFGLFDDLAVGELRLGLVALAADLIERLEARYGGFDQGFSNDT